jgi:hypothetical protein
MHLSKWKWLILAIVMSLVGVILVQVAGWSAFAAYSHAGDIDSVNFRTDYPDLVGTKLDSCALCHKGGDYTAPNGKTSTLGSCQYCHAISNYDPGFANFDQTLNAYGAAYLDNGRSAAALLAIQDYDSDGDGYSNLAEINAVTYPGDANDDPSKLTAPSCVFTLQELEKLPQYSEFLLMNASKSDDEYVEYSGVILEDLIGALKLDSASAITVYSPDGFATYHPFTPSTNPNSYHVFGTYPALVFHYNEQADMATNPSTGWVDYSAPSAAGRTDGDTIVNSMGLKMLLAIKRDGQYLTPGVLNTQNKLDGEGPFRVVPPQKNPGPPDQRSTASDATDPSKWVWPYSPSADHNAGFSSRTVTMIKVEPMPAGTTDINTLEAGWQYVDEGKIIIYGAIDPNPVNNMVPRLNNLIDIIQTSPDSAFKNASSKTALMNKVQAIKKQVDNKAYNAALNKLQEDVLKNIHNWVTDQVVHQQIYSAADQVQILLILIN